MSFPRKRESSQTYKKLVFLGLFYELMYNFCTGIKIIFLDSRFRGNDIEKHENDPLDLQQCC
ncbi:hypothetical protein [Rickettsia asembonensis]|uniref:hypothetical protein n=1 Tax=Rickettsia asembonensis TaxID=1068590 RepID=UPI0011BA6AB5|nr:hypothetical protein [Rickettsia asembonensis]HJD58305.1 hypothetical protein [Rickettsia endosymbiont of Ceroptres masudai]